MRNSFEAFGLTQEYAETPADFMRDREDAWTHEATQEYLELQTDQMVVETVSTWLVGVTIGVVVLVALWWYLAPHKAPPH